MPLPDPNPEQTARSRERIMGTRMRNAFLDGIRLEVVSADYGVATYRVPFTEHTTGPDGAFACGALLTLVDHAGALACWMTTPFGDPSLFGSTIKTQYDHYGRAVQEDIYADAEALAIFGDLYHAEVRLRTAAGVPVGHGTTTYRIVTRRPRE